MLAEWISVFQLGAALSLVLGAYANHREPRQEKLETWIKEALEQIEELRKRDGGAVPKRVPDGKKLNEAEWEEMSTTDLNHYRRDVTFRYFKTIDKFKRNDRARQIILWVNGVLSMVALVVASANGTIPVPAIAAIAISCVLLGVPCLSMVTVWREDLFLQREASPSDSKEAEKKSRTIKMRSDPSPGQAFHVFNEIRRRFRDKLPPDLDALD